MGAAAAAHSALERVHAPKNEFVLHFDVDTLSSREFGATDFPGEGGLSLNEVRDALRVFAVQPNLAAIVVAGYNPELDPNGEAARRLVDLLAEVLAARLETASGEAAGGASAAADSGSTSSADVSRPEPESSKDTARGVQESPEPDPKPS